MDVQIEGKIAKQEGGFRFTQITLQPSVTIEKPEDRDRAQRLTEKAERICLVSRSMACPIAVEPKIGIAEPVAAR